MKELCEICGVDHPTSRNIYHGGDMRVLITTFPKSGTNLIAQIFGSPQHIPISHNMLYSGIPIRSNSVQANNELTLKKMAAPIAGFDGVAFGHIPYNYTFFEAMNHKPTMLVQLIRDPRDVIVSHYHYVIQNPLRAMNYILENGSKLTECDDPILELIKLSPPRWAAFTPWLEHAHVIRYEDLRADPLAQAKIIVQKLGIDEAVRLRIGSESAMVSRIRPQKSPTFRKGGVGDWKSFFKPHHKKLYEEIMCETHEELGYEFG